MIYVAVSGGEVENFGAVSGAVGEVEESGADAAERRRRGARPPERARRSCQSEFSSFSRF